MHDGGPQVRRSAASTVADLFRARVRVHPDRPAVEDGTRSFSYRELDDRARRLAGLLAARGVGQGDRIAILSENRLEYLELFIAAARLGAIAACQNWRLSTKELAHCLGLVTPSAILVSPRHAGKLEEVGSTADDPIVFGEAYERALAQAPATHEMGTVEPEDALLILYTSGTTGLPKGAVISHRAEIARNLVIRAEFGVAADDTFVAWSPLYHMGAAECSLLSLIHI